MSMDQNQFHTALGRLEALAKGTTQLHHTGSDSNPGSWSGGTQTDVDEHQDGIDENGTDYNGVKKSLALKVENSQALTPAEVHIAKGNADMAGRYVQGKLEARQTLSPAENWFFQGGWRIVKGVSAASKNSSDKPGPAGAPGENDDASNVPGTHGGENEGGAIEQDAQKSFAGSVSQNQTLQDGLELSPFLYEFARATSEGLEGVEARIVKSVHAMLTPIYEHVQYLEQQLGASFSEQGEFNKSFAETLVGVGQHVAGGSDAAFNQAQMPAGPPKSHLRSVPGGQQGQGVQTFEKSFGPGGLDVGQGALNKSQISDAMVGLVKAGKLSPLEVSRFEMTDQLSPATESLVKSFAFGQNQ